MNTQELETLWPGDKPGYRGIVFTFERDTGLSGYTHPSSKVLCVISIVPRSPVIGFPFTAPPNIVKLALHIEYKFGKTMSSLFYIWPNYKSNADRGLQQKNYEMVGWTNYWELMHINRNTL